MDSAHAFPLATVHPTDPEIFAFASVRSPAADADRLGATTFAVSGAIFLTEDGGNEWRRIAYPIPDPIEIGAPLLLDMPTSIHLSDGEHLIIGYVVGSVDRTGVNAQRRDLYIAESFDLGRTWERPIRINSPDADVRGGHLLVEHDLLVASWVDQTRGEDPRSHIAWRRSAEWTKGSVGEFGTAFEMQFLSGDRLYLTKTERDGNTSFWRVDLEGDEHEKLSHVPRNSVVMQAPGGTFLRLHQAILWGAWVLELHVSTSRDGGTTWTKPVDAFANSTIMPSLECCASTPWGINVDRQGLLHVVVNQPTDAPLTGIPLINEGREMIKVHFVFDPQREHLLHESRLTPTEWTEGRRTPPSVWPDWEDPNSQGSVGVVPLGCQTLLVWAYDKGLDYTTADITPHSCG